MDVDFRRVLNDSLRVFFKDALWVTLTKPSQAYFFFRTLRWQRKAAQVRSSWAQRDIHVPPIMIFSITNRCNLDRSGDLDNLGEVLNAGGVNRFREGQI